MKHIMYFEDLNSIAISELKKREHILFCCGHQHFKALSYQEAEWMRCLRNLEDNRFYFFYSEIITQEKQREWYDRYLQDDTQFMVAVYEEDQTETPIGYAGIYDIVAHDSAEIGRLLTDSKRCSVRGTGGVICDALSGFCLAQFSLQRLYAYILQGNQRSINSFLRAGYVRKMDHNDHICMELQAKKNIDVE